MTDRARLETADAMEAFIFAGNATFTVVSKKSGVRFTFKVKRAQKRGPDDNELTLPWFVALLNGPDNENDYQFLGTVFVRPGRREYLHGRRSSISAEAPSATAIAWFLRMLLARGPMLDQVEVWHEGRCGRCGRKLTVPESVAAGLGPECAGRISTTSSRQPDLSP